jgi:hypothetical protein
MDVGSLGGIQRKFTFSFRNSRFVRCILLTIANLNFEVVIL